VIVIQPLPQTGRQQRRLLTIAPQEVLRHNRSLLTAPDTTKPAEAGFAQQPHLQGLCLGGPAIDEELDAGSCRTAPLSEVDSAHRGGQGRRGAGCGSGPAPLGRCPLKMMARQGGPVAGTAGATVAAASAGTPPR
jgi:hypothetical protein